MESDTRTTGPAHRAVAAASPPPPPPRRSRSLLGLPARLAGLTMLSIIVCISGITAYADQRMRASSQDRAIGEAVATARDISSQVSEADFAANGEQDKMLISRLDQLVASDYDVRGVVLFQRAESGSTSRVASSSNARAADFTALVRAALNNGEESARIMDSDSVRIAWPMTFGDGNAGGVVAVDVAAGDALAGAADSRRQLLLGSIIGGALLGALVLMLLRRELFRPLEELRRVMVQIRRGATGVRIGWDRSDELGIVAAEFDGMVAELEGAQAELARFVNRDPLTGLLTRSAFTDRFSGELTRARREGYPISLVAIDVDELDDINRTHDEAAGDQVLATIGEVIGGCTRPTDACGRTGGDSFHVALVGADAAQAAVVIQRIRREVAQQVGIGPERTRVTCGFGVAEYPSHAVDQIALERMAEAACTHAQRNGRDQALAFGPAGGYVDVLSLVPDTAQNVDKPAGERELASTVHALARALDGIDPSLGGGAHSQRVARYAVAVARELQLTDGQLRELRSAAVLHDVGKVAVPPSILRMPEEELDERQRGALRYHAWVSRTMIAGAGLASVADIVFHLPERWDGTGYPERAREEKIPLSSRILRAAELLDELTAGQGGREPLTPFAAATELKKRAGSELDPDIAVRLAKLVRDEGLLGTDNRLADAA